MTATATTTPLLSPAWETAARDDAVPSWKEATDWAFGLSVLYPYPASWPMYPTE